MYWKRFDSGTDGFSANDGVRTFAADYRYGGLSNNATTYLQDLLDEASSLNSAELGRVKVIVPAGVWMVDGLQPKPNTIVSGYGAILRKRANGSTPLTNSIIRGTRVLNGSTWYGNFDNMHWEGFRFESNGFSCPAHIVRFDDVRNCYLKDLTVVHSAGVNVWAFQICGQNIRIDNPTVLNGNAVFQDGLHLTYGRDIEVRGGYIQCGDDAIALGNDIVDPSQIYDDQALEYVTITGTRTASEKGLAVKIYYGQDNQSQAGVHRRKVRHVICKGITGYSGRTRNGGIALLDASGLAGSNPSVIQNIDVEASLLVGGATNDGTNAYGVHVQTGENVKIKADLTIVDTTGAAPRFRPSYVEGGRNVSITHNIPAATGRAAALQPMAAGTVVDEICWKDSDFYASSTSGIDLLNTQNANVGTVRVHNTVIRGITNGQYGILADGSNDIAALDLHKVTFKKLTGATNARGYAAGTATVVTFLQMQDCDFSDVNIPSTGTFSANHANYLIDNNRGFPNKFSGTATIGAAATSVTVTHNCPIDLAGTADINLAQIKVQPISFPTNAVNWRLGTLVDADTFSIVSSGVPGGSGWAFSWSIDVGKKPVNI